jgi:hypothetical protein
MAYHGFFQHEAEDNPLVDIQIWRQPVDPQPDYSANWGDSFGDLDLTKKAPIPALIGRELVDTIYGCVVEPRTTAIDVKSGHIDGYLISRATLFLSDPRAHIGVDDMIAFVGHNGKLEAWKLDGDGEASNYVSPFTGVIGGRELFIQKIKGMRGKG